MLIKEPKSWKILIIVIMVPFFCLGIVPVVLYSYGHYTDSVKKVYETNWGITLPEGMNLLGDKKTMSFHGDGIRHTIYSIPDEVEYFKSFRTAKNDEIEELSLDIVTALNVEYKYTPDFKKEYVWKEYTKYSNKLIVIYFPDKKELHLFQQLS